MCGFLGVAGVVPYNLAYFSDVLDELKKRGPNQKGIVSVNDNNIIFGHRRLSIHDLSDSAKQPFVSADGSCVLVFNGEIYNFLKLRKDLEVSGENFITTSDTEVLFKLLTNYPIDEVLSRIEGMFAFSYIDLKKRKLYLVRDRFGEKPLVYSMVNGGLYFGSEVIPVAKLIKNKGHEVEPQALSDFIHYGYIKGEHCIFKGLKKVKPATYIEFDFDDDGFHLLKSVKYYSINMVKLSETYEERKEKIKNAIESSVKDCLMSDVPVGCFLSGGIDSSLISCIASTYSKKIKTYCIGFDEVDYDESSYAKEVAKYLGTEHHDIKLSLHDLASIFKEEYRIYDEPFADASFLATYAVCKYAKEDITVSLTGDGADELFCGYNRHVSIPALYQKLSSIPYSIRIFLSAIFSNRVIIKIASYFNSFLPKRRRVFNFNEKIEKVVNLLKKKNANDMYMAILVSDDIHQELGLPKPTPSFISNNISANVLSLHDIEHYLHEDVLVKVDRAAMSVSLETRAPFLNSYLADLSYSIPLCDKIGKYGQKSILKDILFDYIPSSFFERRKSGFSVPYGRLIDFYLKEFIEDEIRLISKKTLTSDFSQVFDFVYKYYNGSYKDKKIVWNIFCFISWLKGNSEMISK